MNPRPRRLARSAEPLIVAMLVTLVLAAAGCGAGNSGGSLPSPSGPSTSSSPGASVRESSVGPRVAGQARAFAWLRPSPAPAAWRTSRLPDDTARLTYPLRWRSIRSDPGTVSAALRSGKGRIRGYLNATPKEGAETLSNWSAFRVDHNRDEGDADVKLVASGTNLRFRRARGSCVVDDYRSSSGRSYREIACIVAGARATTVVVGAAPPARWPWQGPVIERAISSFLT
jgi:hypothetical protein